MPNIEIYGQPDDHARSKMYVKVTDAMRNLTFQDDIVITDLSSVYCYDLRGCLQPFIRVYDTDKKEIDMVVEALQPLGYDIETLLLTGFYPGKKK
ncbi:MAG: hypothetical protein AAB516_00740 [Patescibacteria group bacterium]